MYQEFSKWLTTDFTSETMDARAGRWHMQNAERKSMQTENSIPAKLPLKHERDIKKLSDLKKKNKEKQNMSLINLHYKK